MSLRKLSLLILFTPFLCSVCFGQSTYWLTDLGTLGGQESIATSINDSRQITGFSTVSDPNSWQAFLYENGVMNPVGNPAGFQQSTGSSINASGAISLTAYTFPATQNPAAFLYQNGGFSNLGAFGGDSFANSINNAGVVIGVSQGRAFRYDSVTGMVDLIGALGVNFSSANDIDNSGRIVGWRQLSGTQDSFVLDGASRIDIPRSIAIAISDSGLVTGYTLGDLRAFSFAYGTPNASIVSLGTLGGSESYGYDCNSLGQIVGYSHIFGNGDFHAFVHQDNVMYDLNDLVLNNSGWTLNRANSINSAGDIVGFGQFNGERRAFMLVSVPEPTSVLPLTLLAAAVLMRRSRRGMSV